MRSLRTTCLDEKIKAVELNYEKSESSSVREGAHTKELSEW